jgi:cytochrome c biogenesis protein CcmG/thiol:disulfide interchange protein DsbE
VSADVDRVGGTEELDETEGAVKRGDRSGRLRSRSRWWTVAIVLTPIALFAVLLASGLGRDPEVLPSELIGRPAPTFSLPRLDAGGTIELGDLEGQVVVVNFWASWCLPCREEHEALEAAWGRYRERGVVVLGVSFEDTDEGALAFRDELGGDWPLAADPGSRTAIAYGVFGVPETFVIAPDGSIAAKTTGAVTYEWLTEEIESSFRSGDAQ